jgi:DEAD/DEAH box helicase domain-containing protein
VAVAQLSPLEQLVDRLADDPRLVHVERLPARPARYGELRYPLPPEVWDRLGVERLWCHQAEALDLARAGRSVAVATGTASGKSLCFQAAIGEAAATGLRPCTALMLFPTKALAQDQLRSLVRLDLPGVVSSTYDGDSSPEERGWARSHANVVLTNPEMLHVGLLPHHAKWATFFMRLRYVVIDELHMVRGIFGSHVAHLLRRLRRICSHYGSDPTFIFASATIGEPDRLASQLCAAPVTAVTDDGSPRGERLFVLWNPTGDDPAEGSRLTGSANKETARLTAELIVSGHHTIAFCRSRKGTETVAAEVARRLPPALAGTVRPYRGGYLARERRIIEQELFDGRLRGVVATNALELGVDIGGLDACVLNGFPGTMASLWQQAGRAGRESQQSVAVLVAGEDQLDQWLMTHPTEVFTRPLEQAVINPENPYVLLPHLACAAYELPLRHHDDRWWPESLDDGVRQLVVSDRLKLRPRVGSSTGEPVAVWSGRGWPSRGVGLRSGSSDEFRIAHPDGSLVGTVDHARAYRLVHPGAVYLHQGQAFVVRELDLDDLVAYVEAADGGEYTQPRVETDIALLGEDEHRTVGRSGLGLGPVRVRSQVVGYKRFDLFTGEMLGRHQLELPATELCTRAFWYVIDPTLLRDAGISPAAVAGTLHAVEHAAIGIMPLFTICDRWDVGGVSTPLLAETAAPTIVIYDGYPGGAGVAELGFRFADEHLGATLEVIRSCRCEDGCPSCVQSPKCGNGNEPLDKQGAIDLLCALLA